jgi:hypothetical protein
MRDSLHVQSAELSSIISRASMLLTPIGVVLGLALVGQLARAAGHGGGVLVALGFLLLILGLLSGAGALFPLPRAALFPLASNIWPAQRAMPADEQLAGQCSAMLYAYLTNEGVVRLKHRFLVAESLLLGFGTVFLGLAYVIGNGGML